MPSRVRSSFPDVSMVVHGVDFATIQGVASAAGGIAVLLVRRSWTSQGSEMEGRVRRRSGRSASVVSPTLAGGCRGEGTEHAWDDVLSRSERSGGSPLTTWVTELIRAMLQDTSRGGCSWGGPDAPGEIGQCDRKPRGTQGRTGDGEHARGEGSSASRVGLENGAQLKIAQDHCNKLAKKRAQLAEEDANLSALLLAKRQDAAQLQLEMHQATVELLKRSRAKTTHL